MELLRRTHEMAIKKLDDMRELIEKNPALKMEMEYNMKRYGVPFISGSYGGRWREDLLKDVRDLLFEEMPYKLIEIRIYPEDPDGHHWGVEYNLLVWDEEKGFVKAFDYERSRRGDESGGNKGSCF